MVRYRKLIAGTAAAFALAPAAPAWAQADSATAQETRDYNVPTGQLSQSALTLSEQAGVQVVFDAATAGGVQASAVQGRLTVDQAIGQLLAGTGLQWRWLRAGVVTIEPAATAAVGSERMLGPVRVQGAQGSPYFGGAGQAVGVNGINGSRDITATEGTGSFTSGALTIGSKAPQAIKDVPQSVSVITSEQMQQQNITDFTKALEQAPGISLAQGETSLQNTFYSRGFEITSIQIDGGAPLTTRFNTGSTPAYFPQIDLSQYDHVEILRGAAGLFNGYGDPSGTINLVRKKPLDHAQFTLEAQAGSWENFRVVLDATSPLAFEGKLRGRLVVTWQDNEHFYKIAKDQKTLIYSVLEYDLTPSTLVSTGISNTNQDSAPWRGGLPRYQTGEGLQLPRSTSIVFPWNRWDFDTTEIFGSIEQSIRPDWTAKLTVTRNSQESNRKLGYSNGAVNPMDGRGPRLAGTIERYASEQVAAEAVVSGAVTIFGQRQELTFGINRSNSDGGGRVFYSSFISSSATNPYQPYPGGPLYCTTASICPTRIASPPIDIFDFDPYDPLYTEPANPWPTTRYNVFGQVQTVAYLNLRLTAVDRLHLATGLRWSQRKSKRETDNLCTSIPPLGTSPTANLCAGRQIGDVSSTTESFYTSGQFSWPPAISLSYDLTGSLTAYLGYTDIYEDQSSFVDGDLSALNPVTGENIEAGLKWQGRDGRINAALSAYRIKKRGFALREPTIDRVKLNPDGSIFRDANNEVVFIANDGTELPGGRFGDQACCYFQRDDQTMLSEGIDVELTGEIVSGLQVSASYTFSQNEQQGAFYADSEVGRPFVSIQPEHLYKLWASYDFEAAGATGPLSNLSLSAGVNGQSKGYRSGTACPEESVGMPNEFTGVAPCLVSLVPYEFTVESYAVASGRIDYRLNANWSATVNLENIFDKSYYRSVNTPAQGNWYGSPRSVTASLRGRW